MSPGQRSTPPAPPPQVAAAGAAAAWDEAFAPSGKPRPHWQAWVAGTQHWTAEDRTALISSAARQLEDLGRTFNVYSDAGGADQPFQIDPVPLLVTGDEWSRVAAGLEQRMCLLECVLQDLYGPQELLRSGLLPPELIHSNPNFRMRVRAVSRPVSRHLALLGTDLVRTPDGAWVVLKDHTHSPVGLGQAVENRKVMAGLLPDLFESHAAATLGPFFDQERHLLRSLCGSHRGMPNVVLLTPGFRHPSYFEHAYKARLLGIPLVEAADLTVRERRLFLKTLGGLRKIDVVACRLGADAMDPLEAAVPGAGGGVPGLLEAWRSGNVMIANAPGAGFASCESLLPFLGRVCREWLGEDLKLPFVETWWLGQKEVRSQVLDQLHRFVLMRAHGTDPYLPLRGSTLSQSARRTWLAAIEASPQDFVVQRDLAPGVVPSIRERSLKPLPVVWRAYTVAGMERPVVMPGGLARVGLAGSPPQLWPPHAGFTKDVWVSGVVADRGGTGAAPTREVAGQHPASFEVPSRIAEQLFWVGRYAERLELTTRLLRVTLRRMGGEEDDQRRGQLAGCLELLRCLNLPGSPDARQPDRLAAAIAGWVHDPVAVRGITTLTRTLISNAASARDRLSDDMWRVFTRLETIIHPADASRRPGDLLRTLDGLVLQLSAIAGMQAENMTRGHGWRFLETGRRIERAIGVGALVTAAHAICRDNNAGCDRMLEPLLETCDSSMTYRRRHFSRPTWEGVVALIVFDRTNPRSIAHQAQVLTRESTKLPGDSDARLAPRILESIAALDARFERESLPQREELKEWNRAWEGLSDLLTQQFFSHSARRFY
jgi:uncharacterized circularly permuted ATP-grasp superfamily protein/uncharacterized alpha-E superfamily protein